MRWWGLVSFRIGIYTFTGGAMKSQVNFIPCECPCRIDKMPAGVIEEQGKRRLQSAAHWPVRAVVQRERRVRASAVLGVHGVLLVCRRAGCGGRRDQDSGAARLHRQAIRYRTWSLEDNPATLIPCSTLYASHLAVANTQLNKKYLGCMLVHVQYVQYVEHCHVIVQQISILMCELVTPSQ